MSEENHKDDEALPDAISEKQQLAKYDFYLEMLENVKQMKEDEYDFMAAFRAIAAVRGIRFHDLVYFCQDLTLQQLIFKYNSQLRDLEKRRKPQEQLKKSLDQLVELIEDTDSVIKQYTWNNFLSNGHSCMINGKTTILNIPWSSFAEGSFKSTSSFELLKIYATLHSVVNCKAPQ